jgi:hypothetical protein
METVTSKLVSVAVKVKQDGSGEYYMVDMTDDAGKRLPQHLCFDKKICNAKPGDTVIHTSTEKDGRWFLNFPKEQGSRSSQGGVSGKGSDLYAKINGILQTHTMPMSYAKDAVIAMLANNAVQHQEVGPEEVADSIIMIYRKLRNNLIADPDLASLLGIKGVPKQNIKEDKEAMKQKRASFEKDVDSFLGNLHALGWKIADPAKEAMLKRMSMTRDAEGKSVQGKDNIKAMTDEEVNITYDRFRQFQNKECPGDPKGCKYFKEMPSGPEDHGEKIPFCSWTSRCFYTENITGRGGA